MEGVGGDEEALKFILPRPQNECRHPFMGSRGTLPPSESEIMGFKDWGVWGVGGQLR